MGETIIFIFFALVVYLNLVATIHLTQSDLYSPGQKVVQLVLIWLVPIIGASIVIKLIMEEPAAEKRLPGGDSFIVRFLLLSFIFSSATVSDTDSDALDSSDAGGFDGGGDGGGGE
jgi:uncharacterized membrane protein YgcG